MQLDARQVIPVGNGGEDVNTSAGLEALARAFDKEDAAQRGEPDPWLDGADDAEWVSERLACAQVAADAYRSALIPPSRARCCSAASPCSWQRHNGMDSVCPTCTAAAESAFPQAVAPTGWIAGPPERIRVAQDPDGFWTCRQAVSGSQEYIRDDLYYAANNQVRASEAESTDLRRKLEEARKALEPFAKYLDSGNFDLDHKGEPLPDDQGMGWVYLTVGDFRRARALTSGGDNG